ERACRQVLRAAGGPKLVERLRESRSRARKMEKPRIIPSVADQDAPEQLPAVVAEDEPLVDASYLILVDDRAGGRRVLERLTERRDVGPEELELCRQVAAAEGRLLPGEAPGEDVGHLVAGSDEPVDCPLVEGDLADGEDAPIACPEVVVDDHPAALS